MTALLISVRSAAEARTALVGGAALIDIKEPARGSLGRADDVVIHDIVAAVAGRAPVSAALGEWTEDTGDIPDADLTYVKWGLAGCARRSEWRDVMSRLLDRHQQPKIVLTAYADWQCARAPAVDAVFAMARRHPGSTLLVDTHCKEAASSLGKPRPTLLDWLPAPWITDLCVRCREASVKIALAGSLGLAEIRALAAAQPDWFAVRGAVCNGDRHGTVQVEKVRQLVELLRPTPAG